MSNYLIITGTILLVAAGMDKFVFYQVVIAAIILFSGLILALKKGDES